MKIGVPKEIKNNENRVAMTPAGVVTLKNAGHDVYVETGAGLGSSFTDDEYEAAGAIVTPTAKEAWAQEMVMKVKEPLPEEYNYFYEGLILFTYLHLANEPELTRTMIEKKVKGINTLDGYVTYQAVAEAHGLDYSSTDTLLEK